MSEFLLLTSFKGKKVVVRKSTIGGIESNNDGTLIHFTGEVGLGEFCWIVKETPEEIYAILEKNPIERLRGPLFKREAAQGELP